ncbi:TPA: hypothetical protein I7730_25750 [Vibrio vulnificus]|uniref:Uncharacterized protein n=1 Tax=Vibrio vulnificus TaxID=672 RepID=A0A8H9N5M3_VIBVL|nr:hypothetical protein [Vibrio vulnificus]EJV9424751.1 hypothetical protein [Vibrio vulnificus]MCU8225524.1 hypothetical protein [Vibrio vulnificus]MDS1833311.1 hypothetical protein [Vibrio vulnificus]HAS8502040.1 hypothetical protein [Vibrio vulnificus]HAS8543136.1 hypothetical protein [Vibrio vulnificus]
MSKIWVYHTFQPDDENFEVSIRHVIVAKNKAEANKVLISYEKPTATEIELNKKFETTTEMLKWLNAENNLGVHEWDAYPHVNWVCLSGKLASPMGGISYYLQFANELQEYVKKNPSPQLEKMINKRLTDVKNVEKYLANR